MRMIHAIAISLVLASVSVAQQENLTVGPYKVCFDLNAAQEYNIDNLIKHSETYCGFKYDAYTIIPSTSKNLALVTIVHFADEMNTSGCNMQNCIETLLESLNCTSIEIHTRAIDNQTGVLGVGANPDNQWIYAAEYWPTLNASGDTNVLIQSNYPWDNETLNLLRTITIEWVNNTTQVL
jgi:hypothetical protein